MSIIPVAEWRPDQPDLSEATSVLLNAWPITPASYGPAPSLAPYGSSALDNQCLGAVTYQDVDQSVHIFAGTVDKLYHLSSSSGSWTDVSVSGGYSVASGENWRFTTYERSIIATDFEHPVQVFTLGTSSAFATLSSGAPQARHVCTPKNFCMLGNTYDSVGGYNPARLWWSASGNAASFPTPGTTSAQQVMSDYEDIPGQQGAMNGLHANLGGCDVAVIFQRGVWRGFYVGPPDVFDFYPAEAVRGSDCPNGSVSVGGVVYYPGQDGFYAYDGNQSQPIGAQKVDAWFWRNVNRAYLYNVIGCFDVANKMVLFAFPSIHAPSALPDTLLGYRLDTQRWGVASIALEWLVRALTFTLSPDSMPAAGYTNTDTLPYSLDSPAWIGGQLQMAAFNQSHILGYLSGPALAAQIATKAMQLVPNRRAFVQSARPLVDASGATIAVSGRVNYYDTEVFGSDVAVNAAGECPFRSDARYHRMRVDIPAGTAWTQCTGVDVTAIPAGSR